MTQINVGLCAYGLSGRIFHQPFIKHHPGFHLRAVLERTRSESATDNPDITIYRDLDALLADPQIDLVVVNTPNYLHYEHAARALRAKKHVIVEKPFTTTAEEANSLSRLAEQQGLLATVYHNRRYDSDFLTVKKVIEEGRLGRIIDAEFRFDRFKPTVGPKRFKEEPGPGSGFLYDLGSHIADQAVVLFGRPEAVFADCRKVREHTAVDDFVEVILYYASGKRVRLLSGQMIRHPLPAYSIHGVNGSFIMERNDWQEELLIAGKAPEREGWALLSGEKNGSLTLETGAEPTVELVSACIGDYMEYYNAVYETIVSGRSFPIKPEEIVDVISILEAAQESNDSRRLITL